MTDTELRADGVVAIVQARMGSSRLPGKVLLDIGGQPMLVRVVERAGRARSVGQVMVATTIDLSDDPVERLCQQRGYLCYRGSPQDVLDRYYQAARRSGARLIVRITADCPVIDPDLIDQTVDFFLERTASGDSPAAAPYDFVANRLPPPWGRTYPVGLDVEVCSFAGLETAWREATLPHQREHVMPFFYDNPQRFRIGLVNHDVDLSAYRWTVDTPEDLEVMRAVYARFGGADDFTWLDVLKLFEREPELANLNAQVRHKHYREVDERQIPPNMDNPISRLRLPPVLAGILLWLALSLAFSLAYTQSHLYNDNQNTKFLHGLASGGLGLLEEDWLAKTADPLPVFSLLVSLTIRFFSERLFYIYFALLMGVYAYSLLGIAAIRFGFQRSASRYLLVFTTILAVHSIAGQIFVKKLLDFDLELLHFGLAGQYLLGLDFQNSSFGVFLLLSMYAFLQRKHAWAIVWLAVASTLHSAYLFSAALMTAAYLGIIFFENLKGSPRPAWAGLIKAARQPFGLGLLALVLVAPVVVYSQLVLNDTSPALSAQALEILVHERIPHHSLPAVWMDSGAWIQVGILLVGLVLAWRSRLFPVVFATFLGGLLGTLVQIATGSDSLALLAPWRVSVILMPLSTCLIIALPLARLVERIPPRLNWVQPVLVVACLAVIAGLARQGLTVQRGRFARYERQDVHAVMEFVRQSKASGQVYLIPPRDNRFDEFRTYTGAPAFINWKSHPYRDFEVMEWYQRNLLAKDFYNQEPDLACQTLANIVAQVPVTHVVVDLEKEPPVCASMQETYADPYFAVYALSTPQPGY